MTIPYYKRGLNSFADNIIAKAYQSHETGLWYAVLDRGDMHDFGPDFSRCAGTPDKAIKCCADDIRAHACRFSSYDMDFRLKKHWAQKEASPPPPKESTRPHIKAANRLAKELDLAASELISLAFLAMQASGAEEKALGYSEHQRGRKTAEKEAAFLCRRMEGTAKRLGLKVLWPGLMPIVVKDGTQYHLDALLP